MTMIRTPRSIAAHRTGVGAWVATRELLKQQIVAYGGAMPGAMPTSPTFTVGAGAAGPTLGGTTIAKDDPRIRSAGGDSELTGEGSPVNNYMSLNHSTRSNGTREGRVGAKEFDFEGVMFETRVYRSGLGSQFHLYVDGLLSANAYLGAEADGSQRWIKIDFTALSALPVRRHIRIEYIGRGTFGGLKLDVGGVIYAPTPPANLRVCILGDSFIEGTGATDFSTALGPRFSRRLGFRDFRCSGYGATGWNASSGTKQALKDRMAVDGIPAAADVYVIPMGINDGSGIASIVATALAALRAGRPAAMVYVILPWNPFAPTPRSGTLFTVAAEITAACAGRGGVKVLDPDLIEYTKSDATHPDQAGHETLGDWVFNQIKADLGLA